MKDEAGERRRSLLWGIPASLILHVLIAALLIYGLPTPPQQPQEEQPMNVALVPPPEQPKPKPAPPKKEPQAEKPPEPQAEKPPEPKPVKPPEEPRKPDDSEVLKRVFQYGAKDTGPKKSLDGGSAQDNAPSPAKDQPSKPPAEQKAEEKQSAAAPPPQTDQSKAEEKPTPADTDAKPAPNEEKPVPDNADKQETAPQTPEKQADVAPKPLAPQAGAKPEPVPEKAKPKATKAMKFTTANAKPSKPKSSKSRSANAATADSTDSGAAGAPVYGGLPGVRKLFSQGATGDALATSSMSGVPRDRRIANLCANVLDTELQGADYSPKWLPTIPLKTGNVLSPQEAAFSTMTTWYRLSFRCEVDADATRVLSFSFRVGPEIPRGEWPPGHPL